jgi:arylsulfatase A-like enzyme
LYWERRGWQVVRFGDWKASRTAPDEPIELYNLRADLGEQNNVAEAHPELVAKAAAYFRSARTEDPNWPLIPRKKKK